MGFLFYIMNNFLSYWRGYESINRINRKFNSYRFEILHGLWRPLVTKTDLSYVVWHVWHMYIVKLRFRKYYPVT